MVLMKLTIYNEKVVNLLNESGFFDLLYYSELDHLPVYTFSKNHDRMLKIDQILNDGENCEGINKKLFDIIQEVKNYMAVSF
jgi:hypothetical protein